MAQSMGISAMIVAFASLTFYMVKASDPSPLQDFCVGVTDPKTAVNVNGFFCKKPKDVTTNDFIYKGFDTVGVGVDTNRTVHELFGLGSKSTRFELGSIC